MQKTYPRISIVTPSFNQGRFLEETILSVLNQGYPNLEYFVMDGGSTDNSVEIIQKYASQLTYWESKPDKGQSHAINKGFKMATGELVAWLNSDDLYTPGVLFEVANIWQDNQSVGFIHGRSELIDEFGKPTGKIFGSEFPLYDALMTYENNVAQQSTFINRKVLDKVGYLIEEFHMSMDWDLWLKIACEHEIKYVPNVWSKYRIWSETKTAKLRVIAIPEQHRILKSFFNSKGCSLSAAEKRRIFGVFWGKKAAIYYRHSEKLLFWKSLCYSLIYSPKLRGGESKNILYSYPLVKRMDKAKNSVMEIIKKVV